MTLTNERLNLGQPRGLAARIAGSTRPTKATEGLPVLGGAIRVIAASPALVCLGISWQRQPETLKETLFYLAGETSAG